MACRATQHVQQVLLLQFAQFAISDGDAGDDDDMFDMALLLHVLPLA